MTSKKRFRRLLSMLLCLALCLTLVPATAFAGELTEYDEVFVEEYEDDYLAEETAEFEESAPLLMLASAGAPIESISGNGNKNGCNWNVTLDSNGILHWENGNNKEKHSIFIMSGGSVVGGVTDYTQYSWDITSYMEEQKMSSGTYRLRIDQSEDSFATISFYYVSPLPKLSEPQNLRWEKSVAKWDPVANATSYNVGLYSSTGYLKQRYAVNAPQCYVDLSLVVAEGCSFRVTACADGYVDSSVAYGPRINAYTVTYYDYEMTTHGTMNSHLIFPDSDGTVRDYVFPKCAYEPPAGCVFDHWLVNDTGRTESFTANPGDNVYIFGDINMVPISASGWTISFATNGGSGSMTSEVIKKGDTYTLPTTCDFTPPAGKKFGDAWIIEDSAIYNGNVTGVGQTVAIASDTFLKPYWVDIYNSLDNYGRHITVPEIKAGAAVDFTKLFSSDTYGLADPATIPGRERPIYVYKCNPDGSYIRDAQGHNFELSWGDKFEAGYCYEFEFFITLPGDVNKEQEIYKYFEEKYYPIINGTPCEPDSFDYEDPYVCHVFWKSPVVECRNHDFSEQPYQVDENGKHYQKCKGCGAESTHEAHTGGTATCTAKAKCSTCGTEYGSLAAHTYDTKWSTDGTNHWHACTVCGNKKDSAAHTLKTATVTKATTTNNGKQETKCTVCNKVTKTATIYAAKTIKLSATTYTYDGKVKKPSVTVKNSAGTTLKKDTAYTVTYASGRKAVGKYKVTIKGKGKYSFTKTLTFKINPVKTSISSLTKGTKSFTVKWAKKTTQTTGYEIQYSTSSTFKAGTATKKVTVTSNKTTSKTIKSLKAKKKYYVRVRTYKTVNGTKYYSAWCTKKYVTTK